MTLSSPVREGQALGRLERDRSLSIVERYRRSLTRRAARRMVQMLLDGRDVSCDDVRAVMPAPPDVGRNYLGSAVRSVLCAGLANEVGRTASRYPECHGRRISVYRLRDRDAAERWLVDHPPIPGPAPTTLFPEISGDDL